MANEKILVVDDDKNICELLRLYLVKEGYNVTMVHDGGAALAEFDKLHPDLVLLDVMMPVMDGWEVCRKIRAKDSRTVGLYHGECVALGMLPMIDKQLFRSTGAYQ